jgi:hypothetical protein
MRWFRGIASAALLLAAASTVQAQPKPAPPLDAAARTAAIHKAADALRRQYVFPAVGEKAAALIEARLAAGAYDSLSDPAAFAGALTNDLSGVAHDKHLRAMTMGGPLPDVIAKLGPPPRREGGVVRTDLLAGDIGYIEVANFPPADFSAASVNRAMATLGDTKALIIDLRRNGGGDPDAVGHLVSFFVPAGKPVHLNDLLFREPGTTRYRTEVHATGDTPTKYLGRPIYVLTGPATFSGGEEFAYDMQTQKLATLVGETTGGGANPGEGVEIAKGIFVFLPAGYARNPITHTNWEGRGVTPDIATPAPQALSVAMARLGQTGATGDVATLSRRRLFSPRTEAQPGGEAAIRRSFAALESQSPDLGFMTPVMAGVFKDQLADMRKLRAPLGALQTVTFRSVGLQGDDTYDVHFEHGAVQAQLIQNGAGKVTMFGFDLE